ncbi:MAG TPA: hypothetical protein VN812_05455 [Candidatus Acidoferrales bacterium]|nr:hypothetical protein [Candidatus Acidoferrales bacterium]
MSDWLDESGYSRDSVRVPIFWVALALSLLIHVAVLWHWLPHLHLQSLDEFKIGETPGSLVVQLAPLPGPPPAPPPSLALPAQPAPALKAQPPRAVARPRTAPPVIALKSPAPASPAPPPATVSTPAPPPAVDLATYIAAHRQARPEPAPSPSSSSAPSADDENARRNRIIAGNLAQRPPTFGFDPAKHGGVFQITHVGYDDAQFLFFGWNKDARHNTMQELDVRTGNNPDIRLAVIRKMIAIIRDNTQTDFLWESQRLGRNVTLSARPEDNAGLEEFLMREFFYDPRMPQ